MNLSQSRLSAEKTRVAVADWQVDLSTGELSRGAERRQLQPKPTEALALLIARRGEVVSKEELLEAVWPDTAVTDDAIWRCIADLRKGLGDDARKGKIVQTLARRGYRLVAEVPRNAAPTEPSPPPVDRESAGSRPQAHPPVGVPSDPPSRSTFGLGLAGRVAGVALLVVLSALAARWVPSWVTEPPLVGGADTLESKNLTTALDYHRMGMTYYERLSDGDLDRARALFERSLELDAGLTSTSASTLAALANVRVLQAARTEGEERKAGLEAAADHAHRALSINAREPLAHKALGLVYLVRGWRLRAEAAFADALLYAPEMEAVAHNRAILQRELGRPDLALAGHRSTNPEEPGRLARQWAAEARALYLLDRLPEARRLALRALDLLPEDQRLRTLLARDDLAAGRLEDALREAEQVLVLLPKNADVLRTAAAAFAASGQQPRLRAALRNPTLEPEEERSPTAAVILAWLTPPGEDDAHRAELLAMAKTASRERLSSGDESWVPCLDLASIAVLAERPSEAVDYLERAQRLGFLDWRLLTQDPMFFPLAEEPRFRQLLDRLRSTVRDLAANIATGS